MVCMIHGNYFYNLKVNSDVKLNIWSCKDVFNASFWHIDIYFKISYFRSTYIRTGSFLELKLFKWPSGQGAGFPFQGYNFKTTGWLHVRHSLSSFRGRLNGCQKVLGTEW